MNEATLQLEGEGCVVMFHEEPTYSPRSADNARRYAREYELQEKGYSPASSYGVVCRGPLGQESSCILFAGGGCTRVHQQSAVIIGPRCFIGVGDQLCGLVLPSLEMCWTVKIDLATCFGVYYSARHRCLLSHGELEIARVDLDGRVIWSHGGRDIFSEDFRVFDDHVEAVDFYHDVYRFEINGGRPIR